MVPYDRWRGLPACLEGFQPILLPTDLKRNGFRKPNMLPDGTLHWFDQKWHAGCNREGSEEPRLPDD